MVSNSSTILNSPGLFLEKRNFVKLSLATTKYENAYENDLIDTSFSVDDSPLKIYKNKYKIKNYSNIRIFKRNKNKILVIVGLLKNGLYYLLHYTLFIIYFLFVAPILMIAKYGLFFPIVVASSYIVKMIIKIHSKKAYNRKLSNKIFSKLQVGLNFKKNYNLVLDLDKTLICSFEKRTRHDQQIITFNPIGQTEKCVYVSKRPHLDEFLEKACEFFNIIIFTASDKAYADEVINFIDVNHYIGDRYYRENCVIKDENIMYKDMAKLNIDENLTIFIDDSTNIVQKDNHFRIKSWEGDLNDNELMKFLSIFLKITDCGGKSLTAPLALAKLKENYCLQINN